MYTADVIHDAPHILNHYILTWNNIINGICKVEVVQVLAEYPYEVTNSGATDTLATYPDNNPKDTEKQNESFRV